MSGLELDIMDKFSLYRLNKNPNWSSRSVFDTGPQYGGQSFHGDTWLPKVDAAGYATQILNL